MAEEEETGSEGRLHNLAAFRKRKGSDATLVTCPKCRTLINMLAVRCPNCRIHFDGPAFQFARDNAPPPPPPAWFAIVLWIVVVLSVLGVGGTIFILSTS